MWEDCRLSTDSLPYRQSLHEYLGHLRCLGLIAHQLSTRPVPATPSRRRRSQLSDEAECCQCCPPMVQRERPTVAWTVVWWAYPVTNAASQAQGSS